MSGPLELDLDDIAEMRKAHPCGGSRWQIVRLGAEIGLRCLTCNRRVLLPRAVFERRVKRLFDAQGNPRPRRAS